MFQIDIVMAFLILVAVLILFGGTIFFLGVVLRSVFKIRCLYNFFDSKRAKAGAALLGSFLVVLGLVLNWDINARKNSPQIFVEKVLVDKTERGVLNDGKQFFRIVSTATVGNFSEAVAYDIRGKSYVTADGKVVGRVEYFGRDGRFDLPRTTIELPVSVSLRYDPGDIIEELDIVYHLELKYRGLYDTFEYIGRAKYIWPKSLKYDGYWSPITNSSSRTNITRYWRDFRTRTSTRIE